MSPLSKGGRFLLIVLLTFPAVGSLPAEESVGSKIKKIFSTPTPTPSPKRHKRSSTSTKEKKPSPTAAPKESAPADPSPEPSESPKAKSVESSPSKKHRKAATDDESAPAEKKKVTKEKKETPTPSPSETPTTSPSVTPTPTGTPALDATPLAKRKGAPATVTPTDIKDYEKYTPEVRKVLDLGLNLTSRNLGYKYGSADPSAGGMDCSGFVYYVLTQSGLHDVPRDASSQYVWLRKSGKFQAVNSHSDDSFELEGLTPGDLMFWTGTYNVEKDPPITHSMIYVGREKGTGQRIMMGSSDGRTYRGESRFGVSVFDFKASRPGAAKEGRTPTFIGYGHVPGIGN